MSRSFGQYNPVVKLNITWEEELQLTDKSGTPVDLTAYTSARAQLRLTPPVYTAGTPDNPVVELTTADAYPSPPAWPVFDGAITIPTPAYGRIKISVDVADLLTTSPTGGRLRLYWDLVLIGADDLRIPVVAGRVTFVPGTTV